MEQYIKTKTALEEKVSFVLVEFMKPPYKLILSPVSLIEQVR